jgi:hypothetical protein
MKSFSKNGQAAWTQLTNSRGVPLAAFLFLSFQLDDLIELFNVLGQYWVFAAAERTGHETIRIAASTRRRPIHHLERGSIHPTNYSPQFRLSAVGAETDVERARNVEEVERAPDLQE